METKKIADSLRCCVSSESCKPCGFLDNQQCRITMKIIAANRLEELEAEIAELQKQLSETPKWISVEDERKPKEGESCIVRSSTGCITIRKYEKGGFPDNHRIRYWIHNPALPKPKEPTFRDVFLKAFPKAPLGYNGAIKLCARNVFPQINCSLSNGCAECWKQTYFEEEGDV